VGDYTRPPAQWTSNRLCAKLPLVSIRAKIILVVLPLLVATLVLTSIASSFSARNGITRVAVRLLAFKAQSLRNYLASQWDLLTAQGLEGEPDFREAVREAADSYARALLEGPAEQILALDGAARAAIFTGEAPLADTEADRLLRTLEQQGEGWVELAVAGEPRVGYAFGFTPLGWHCLISEKRDVFYRDIAALLTRNAVIMVLACAVSLALLVMFSRYLTRPLTGMVAAMRRIIAEHDLTARVPVEYPDETGKLAHTFNLTVSELEKAYNQIKDFAFKAVLARQREQEIRNIFQVYVPQEVIEKFFRNPDSLLVGENRELAVLISDIRGFTAIAERMPPDQMVETLNRYFSPMVDVIMRHGGIVDKYMGDAIMAFFGSPVSRPDDALQAVRSALDMLEALAEFNRHQAELGQAQFRIGTGINFGPVTVGNIGSEKKMNYTVIGDMVNLASRLEGLTKVYQLELIFSESVHAQVSGHLPCRLVDKVQVRGKSQGERIYTAQRSLGEAEQRAWALHHEALEHYYQRRFAEAAALFQEVQALLPGDTVSARFYDECIGLQKQPPPPDWAGLRVLT
jgi:class 3 adenylate cyclase/HAMP domain-containing protein